MVVQLLFCWVLLQRFVENSTQYSCDILIYLVLKPFHYVWFDLIYGISTIVGYLMPNPLYTYILNIYDLAWLSFMAL